MNGFALNCLRLNAFLFFEKNAIRNTFLFVRLAYLYFIVNYKMSLLAY